MEERKVWDALIRIVHWTLALSLVGAALTAGRTSWLNLHILFGSGAVLLVLVRLMWGFLGGDHAHFASFLRAPQAVLAYVRQMATLRAPRMLGHNPPAGWVMLAMLLVVIAIGFTGLAVLGGQEQIGPLAPWLGFEAGHAAKELHEGLTGLMWALVGVHLAGVALHILLHRENVIRSMVTGRKVAPADGTPPARRPRWPWAVRLLVSLAPAMLLVPWLVALPTDYRSPTTQAALTGEVSPAAQLWRKECGPCHFAFAPELLPERSWRQQFATLGDHFGQDAWLPDPTRRKLESYAVAHSADRIPTKTGYRLWRRTSQSAVPMRITASPYWKHRHRAIEPAVFRDPAVRDRTNCGACHRLALAGSFEDSDIAIPHTTTAMQNIAARGH